jgi:hypothetical protein
VHVEDGVRASASLEAALGRALERLRRVVELEHVRR